MAMSTMTTTHEMVSDRNTAVQSFRETAMLRSRRIVAAPAVVAQTELIDVVLEGEWLPTCDFKSIVGQ
jgi:hypothetical protein